MFYHIQEERFLLRHMERQDPQGEENGDPAFAHVPRIAQGSHHSQLSLSSKESNSSSFPPQKQHPQVSMSTSSSIPQSSVSTGPLQQGPVKGKDAAKLEYQRSSGLDWNPDLPFSSAWMRSLAFGNYDEMMKFIQKELSLIHISEPTRPL